MGDVRKWKLATSSVEAYSTVVFDADKRSLIAAGASFFIFSMLDRREYMHVHENTDTRRTYFF